MRTPSPPAAARNFVYIAAARDNEISLDQPGKGGVATQAVARLHEGAARDLDGSGGITADESASAPRDASTLRSRTPKAICRTTSPSPATRARCSPPSATAPALPTPVAGVEPTGAAHRGPDAGTDRRPAPAPVPAPVIVVPPSPHATLADIYNRRDDRRRVELSLAKPALKINKDKFEFTLSFEPPGLCLSAHGRLRRQNLRHDLSQPS